MKKLFITVFAVLVFSPFSHAQSDMTLRSAAADQLYEYGQALYERGQKAEATQIFDRVLNLNPNHPGALHYVKRAPQKADPVKINPAIGPTIAPVIQKTNDFIQAADFQKLNQSLDGTSNADLKQNIKDADQAIAMLQKDIATLESQHSQSSTSIKD